MATETKTTQKAEWQGEKQRRELITKMLVTTMATAIATLWLLPFVFGLITSFKTKAQLSDVNAGILPSITEQAHWQRTASNSRNVDIYELEIDGELSQWGIVKPGSIKVAAEFLPVVPRDVVMVNYDGEQEEYEGGDTQRIGGVAVDITDDMLETISRKELDTDAERYLRIMTAEEKDEARVQKISFAWENYPTAWEGTNNVGFGTWFKNTFLYAFITTIAAMLSAAFVAYGFSRFKFPGKNLLFFCMMATIILPPQVTLIPTYYFWNSVREFSEGAFNYNMGVGTWWPLYVPQFFSNAYNVFLLRQYFMSIPPEMEEAATIDGAGPIRTFFSVILPQVKPALVAVSLFHFFWAWNDYFNPLIYLSGAPEKTPITVALPSFNGLFSTEPALIQAASVIALLLPMFIFFIAQKAFVQGVVFSGNK